MNTMAKRDCSQPPESPRPNVRPQPQDVANTTEGVSVSLLCAVEKHLRRTYRGKNVRVDAAVMNRWISLLGQIEREYRDLATAGDTGERRPDGCYPAIPPSPEEGQNPPSGGSNVIPSTKGASEDAGE